MSFLYALIHKIRINSRSKAQVEYNNLSFRREILKLPMLFQFGVRLMNNSVRIAREILWISVKNYRACYHKRVQLNYSYHYYE